MIIIVQALVPKVIYENVTKLPVRVCFLCKVDNAAFNNVIIDTTDVIGLIVTKNSIITIYTFYLKLAQLISFDYFASMLCEYILY